MSEQTKKKTNEKAIISTADEVLAKSKKSPKPEYVPPTPLANSVKNASQRLDLGATKIYEMLADGRLRGIKIGDRTLIPETELQRLLKEAPAYQPKSGAA